MNERRHSNFVLIFSIASLTITTLPFILVWSPLLSLIPYEIAGLMYSSPINFFFSTSVPGLVLAATALFTSRRLKDRSFKKTVIVLCSLSIVLAIYFALPTLLGACIWLFYTLAT